MTKRNALPAQPSVLKRMTYISIGALVLFGSGFLLAKYQLVPLLSGSEEPVTSAENNAQFSAKARKQLAEQRQAWQQDVSQPAPQIPVGPNGYFQSPLEYEIPDNELGAAIRRGREIFLNPGTNAKQYVGNKLACANCHLDSGRREHSAPMWAAITNYPAYRGKNDMINTIEDRINGCFTFSMNAKDSPSGAAPPTGHQIYKDLESYFYWLADGAAVNEDMPGRGYPELEETELGYDWQRGANVFIENCALCHGEDGQGRQDINGRYIFPPLWGPNSFNWGAGMHRINTAAGFIKANMPFGKLNSLSDQQAWDVAAYINSFPRPADPRQLDEQLSLKEAKEKYHQDHDYYNQKIHGVVLGQDTTPQHWQEFLELHKPRYHSQQN